MVKFFTSADDAQVKGSHVNHVDGPFTITSSDPASADSVQNHRPLHFCLFEHFNTGNIFGLHHMNLILFIDNVFNFTLETEIVLNFL